LCSVHLSRLAEEIIIWNSDLVNLITLEDSLYLARRGRIDESLKPYTWYRDLILCGAEQHELPEDYRQKIENTMDIPDPDENRRAKMDAEAQIREYVNMRGPLDSSFL
jgi:hypothetical protein